MEGMASAVCEILRYLIIYWKCETGISKGVLLEGQLVISIEAVNSKHQPNALHCVTTITSARSICGGLVLKKLQKEIQSILPGFSAKLTSTVGERNCSPDTSGATSFQMIFEVDEKPRTLITDCLVIKHFLRKIIIIHHQIRFNFSVKVNGILSTEIFGAENEPILNLWNGIALIVNYQHYHLYIFLYGPSGLPLLLSNQEQPSTTVLRDICYFIDWKKYHLCVVPNLDLSLDGDLVLPDVSYRVESSEGDQYQNMDPQRQTLLLFLFVDFHSGFLVKQMEIWGTHTLLRAHLSAILMESRSAVRDAIQATVKHVLEQHHQAAKAHQKLQASLSVAVNSVMSVVTGSTNSSFRKTCLQALQATDTQELWTKLHKIFHDVTRHRFLHHCSCDVKQQLTPEKKDSAQSTEDAHESNSLELLAGKALAVQDLLRNNLLIYIPLKFALANQIRIEGCLWALQEREISGKAENKGLKRGILHQSVEETEALRSASVPGTPEVSRRHLEPTAASLTDALWLQEVSNLSEWLSPRHES